MTHDPLCPLRGDQTTAFSRVCQCDLIAQVVERERAMYFPVETERGEEHVDWCRDLACYGCVEVTE
jgi:hypothetical protein